MIGFLDVPLIRAQDEDKSPLPRRISMPKALRLAQPRRILLLTLGLLATAALTAHASPVVYDFTGVVQLSNGFNGVSVGDPVTVVGLQLVLGKTELELGYAARAVHLLTQARDTLQAELGPEDPDVLSAMHYLGEAYRADGQMNIGICLVTMTLFVVPPVVSVGSFQLTLNLYWL